MTFKKQKFTESNLKLVDLVVCNINTAIVETSIDDNQVCHVIVNTFKKFSYRLSIDFDHYFLIEKIVHIFK